MRSLAISLVSLFVVAVLAQAADTPKAADTRKKLKEKVNVEFKDTILKEVLEELKDQVKGLSFRVDTKSGVSQNKKFTYKAKGKPVEEVLAELFKGNNIGYIVISKDKDAYDGGILIRTGEERGTPVEEKK